jgi:hypothetical protein
MADEMNQNPGDLISIVDGLNLNQMIEYLREFNSGRNDGEKSRNWPTINYPAIDIARVYNSLLHSTRKKLKKIN